MKKTMQTYLNILKYPEHRYETLFFCARTWHTLMHTMKRSLKQYQENCGSYFDMVFPMVFRVFPPPWRPMAIRHLHGLQDLCRLFAVLLRWCSLAHLYTPVTKTIPNQEEAWWKLSPTTTSFFVNRTGLQSNITFDLWQIYRDTCGCGSSHSCRRCSSSSCCCWAKALEDLKGSAQGAMTVLPLVYFGATPMDKKQFESNLYIHTLACIIVQSSSSYIYIYVQFWYVSVIRI